MHEFDLEGKFIRAFKFDRRMLAIGINASGTTLFGASLDTLGVYRFRLPPESEPPHR